MPKSLLALQNDRRMAERRHAGYERRNLPDRRKKSEEVSEERRRKERRVLHERRMQERRMHDFQTNIMKKDVLEKEEHALITSRGLDEEEMEDNSNEINAAEMSIASNLAGKAISISKTTAPHALSYPFTSIF